MQSDPDEFIQKLSVAVPLRMPEFRAVKAGRLLAKRSHHAVFLLDATRNDGEAVSLIARVPREDKTSRREGIRREHFMLRYLRVNGFRVAPIAIHLDNSLEFCDIPYSIQSYLPSEPLRGYSQGQIKTVASEVAALHSVNGAGLLDLGFPYYSTPEDYIASELRHTATWSNRVVSELSRSVARPKRFRGIFDDALDRVRDRASQAGSSPLGFRLPPIAIHGDPGLHNFGLASENVIFYDWEQTAIGDPAMDVAKLFRVDFRALQERNEFIDTYQAEICVDLGWDRFFERLLIYESIAALQTVIWSVREAARVINSDGIGEWLHRGRKLNNFLKVSALGNLEYIDERLSQRLLREFRRDRFWRIPSEEAV